MALDHATGGAVILAASATGVATGSFIGPLSFPLADYGIAIVIVGLGALGKIAMDAFDDLQKGQSKPVQFYGASFAFLLLASPLMAGVVLWGMRALGFEPDGAAVLPLFGMGYGGRPLLNMVLSKTGASSKIDFTPPPPGDPKP